MPFYTGHDNLFRSQLKKLKGKRLGLVINQTSVGAEFESLFERLQSVRSVQVGAVFGPQHGVTGHTQDNMIEWQSFRSPKLRIPIYSLYGQHRVPTPQMLNHCDLVLYDIQDVGARYYTFISTLFYILQECGRRGIPVVVCDRPNPIGAYEVEGNLHAPGYTSFVGIVPLPARYGMTCGELARYFVKQFQLGTKLSVIKMTGYRRHLYLDEIADLKPHHWVMPSPNMPTVDTATVYPGGCLWEGTEISEGRGTTRPFELFGAPYADAEEVAEELARLAKRERLGGCCFRPASFLPTFQKHAGKLCHGAQIHVTNRKRFKPYLTGLAVLRTFHRLYGKQFKWKKPPYEYEYKKRPIEILLGDPELFRALSGTLPLRTLESRWTPDLRRFRQARKGALIYR